MIQINILFLDAVCPRLIKIENLPEMAQTAMGYGTILSQDPELLQNCLTGLSGAEFHHLQPADEDAYVRAEEEAKKHVRLNDGLALLLVYQDKGDIAAVFFVLKQRQVDLFWAKNDPTPPNESEKAYLDHLCAAFCTQLPPITILQLYCVPQCRTKILARIKKVAKCFTPLPSERNILKVKFTTNNIAIQTPLRRSGLCSAEANIIDAVDHFLKKLTAADSTSSTTEICQILWFADLLTPQDVVGPGPRDAETSDLFTSPFQLRQVRKLGAWVWVIKWVLVICEKHRIKEIRHEQVCHSEMWVL